MTVVLFTVKTSRKNCQGPILILSDVFVFGTGTPSLTLLPASLRAPPHTHTQSILEDCGLQMWLMSFQVCVDTHVDRSGTCLCVCASHLPNVSWTQENVLWITSVRKGGKLHQEIDSYWNRVVLRYAEVRSLHLQKGLIYISTYMHAECLYACTRYLKVTIAVM